MASKVTDSPWDRETVVAAVAVLVDIAVHILDCGWDGTGIRSWKLWNFELRPPLYFQMKLPFLPSVQIFVHRRPESYQHWIYHFHHRRLTCPLLSSMPRPGSCSGSGSNRAFRSTYLVTPPMQKTDHRPHEHPSSEKTHEFLCSPAVSSPLVDRPESSALDAEERKSVETEFGRHKACSEEADRKIPSRRLVRSTCLQWRKLYLESNADRSEMV